MVAAAAAAVGGGGGGGWWVGGGGWWVVVVGGGGWWVVVGGGGWRVAVAVAGGWSAAVVVEVPSLRRITSNMRPGVQLRIEDGIIQAVPHPWDRIRDTGTWEPFVKSKYPSSSSGGTKQPSAWTNFMACTSLIR